jgi:hypothetical protein
VVIEFRLIKNRFWLRMRQFVCQPFYGKEVKLREPSKGLARAFDY